MVILQIIVLLIRDRLGGIDVGYSGGAGVLVLVLKNPIILK